MTKQLSTTLDQTMTTDEILLVINTQRVKPMAKKNLHQKLNTLFGENLSGLNIQPSFNPNKSVAYYTLEEVEAKMLVASIDVQYLRAITEFFIHPVTPLTAIEQRKEALELAKLDAELAAIEMGTQRALQGAALSLSKLINEHGLCTSVTRLQPLLVKHRLMYGKGAKARITRLGYPYGINFPVGDTTQPRWFSHTFQALLTHINYKD